MMTVYYFT